MVRSQILQTLPYNLLVNIWNWDRSEPLQEFEANEPGNQEPWNQANFDIDLSEQISECIVSNTVLKSLPSTRQLKEKLSKR